MFLTAAMLLALLFWFVLPSRHMLENYQNALSASAMDHVALDPALSEEIDVLKGQLSAIITGSIESKLRSLEYSVRRGTVSAVDVGTIEDLKSDLKILKTYSSHDATSYRAAGFRDARRAGGSRTREQQHVMQELSQLKALFYVSIASCGFLAVAMGAIWLQNNQRFKLLVKNDLRRPIMLEQRDKEI